MKKNCSAPIIPAVSEGKLMKRDGMNLELLKTACTAFVNEWVEQCLLKEVRPQSTIILDNARFHNKSDLERILRKHDHHLLFLPPDSPYFNPIEKTFAHI